VLSPEDVEKLKLEVDGHHDSPFTMNSPGENEYEELLLSPYGNSPVQNLAGGSSGNLS